MNDGAKPRAMKPVFSSIILLGCLVFGAHGGLRNSFSIVALPFRYYGIAPDLVEVAPTEMCQVSVGDETEHCSCGFLIQSRVIIFRFRFRSGGVSVWSVGPFGK